MPEQMTETPRVFRWEMDDGWNEAEEKPLGRWARKHTRDGTCPGCCCGGPAVCSRCGGRVHSEPVSVYDVDGNEETGHAFYCQGENLADGEPANLQEVTA